jgi:hypothetical protein
MQRPRSARPLSELVGPALADALKAQGFAAAEILHRWPDIAGGRLAGHSMPVRIIWPPRPKGAAPGAAPAPATLVLKVEGAFALEAEMAAAQIIERINAVFGWACVGKLRLRQGPIETAPKRQPRKPAVLTAAAGERLRHDLEGIAEPGLREALERLGREVRARRPVTRA